MGRLMVLVLLRCLAVIANPSGSSAETGLVALNWAQTISTSLSGGEHAKVTLSPCPAGIDTTSGAGYQVFISGDGKSEAVKVIWGNCVTGAPSGTITFTPHLSYSAGATIGSASSGIQETINLACGVSRTTHHNAQCNVTIPPNGPYIKEKNQPLLNTYNIYGTIYLHSNQSVLSGYGASLNWLGRGACLQVGDLSNSNDYTDNTVFSRYSPFEL